METKIVFDIDDTLCTNVRKISYANCEPKQDVIDKINYLHDVLGIKIILHTSRGMMSCNGNLEKIIEKNKDVLENWLSKYDVHYDEIIFGKPIADLYIDDKAMNVNDFVKDSFCYLKGGSKKAILKLGNVVKKDLGDKDSTERYKDWIEDNKGFCKYPKVISYLYNEVYIEYIDGTLLSENFTIDDLKTLLNYIKCFKNQKTFLDSFNVNKHVEVLQKNYSDDEEFNSIIDLCITYLIKHKKKLSDESSFCHGDFILSNMIKSKNEIYFIDQNYDREASSYLLDLAKLRMSLSGYEYTFGLSKNPIGASSLIAFDNFLQHYGLYNIVVVLHLMYVCRLYRYKEDKQKVIEIAKELVKENEGLFEN